MRTNRPFRSALFAAGFAALAISASSALHAQEPVKPAPDYNDAGLKGQDLIQARAAQAPGRATWNIAKMPTEGLVTTRQFDQLLPPEAPMRLRWALPMNEMRIRHLTLPPASAGVKYLLVETEQNDLIALRQDNGEALWWVKNPEKITGEIYVGKLSLLYVTGGRFVSLEKNSGDIKENVDLPFAPASGPAAIEEDEDSQIFFITGMDRGVYGFDVAQTIWPPKGNQANITQAEVSIVIDNYRQLWRFSADGVVASTPVVNDRFLVFGTWDKRIYGIDVTSDYTMGRPSVYWDRPTRGGCEASGVADGPNVLIPSLDGNLYSLCRTDGSLSWRYVAPDRLFFSPQLITDSELNKVYVLQKSGRQGPLICLDRVNGTGIWQHDTGVKIIGVLMLENHDARLRAASLILTQDGNVDCVQLSAPDTRTEEQKKEDEAYQNLRRASIAWSLPAKNFNRFATNQQNGFLFCTTVDGSAVCMLEENN